MELNKIYDNKPTELCRLGYKYGTDKCPQIKHSYTPFYYQLLKNRRKTIKKVLELGIGRKRPNTHIPEVIYKLGIKPYLETGASLYMWRDFFPNAQIFGFDYSLDAMFANKRIKTFRGDVRTKEDLLSLIKFTGPDIDLVIDDASHHVDDQIFACQSFMPLLKKNVTYIIEDVTHTKIICQAMSEIGAFDFFVPTIYRKWHGGMMLVIKNKHNGN